MILLSLVHALIAAGQLTTSPQKVDSSTPSAITSQQQLSVSTQNSSNPTLTIPRTEFYGALKSDISASLKESILQSAEKRINLYAWFLAAIVGIAGFFGYRSFSDFKKNTEEKIKKDIESSSEFKDLVDKAAQRVISEMVDEKITKISKEMAFYRVSNLSRAIESGVSFSDQERDAAIESLFELLGHDHITKRDEFKAILSSIVFSFARADLYQQILKIETAFENMIATDSNLVRLLAVHYCMALIGDSSAEIEAEARFLAYSKMCKSMRMDDFIAPFAIAYEYHRQSDDWKARSDKYIEDFEFFDDTQKQNFMREVIKYSDPKNFSKTPTGQIVRFSRIFQMIKSDYADKFIR